jgi:hypothetical protein
MVGVVNDALTHKFKGKTVMNQEERYESVAHCKWVDEVVRDAPWVVDAAFIDKMNIDFIAHDDLPCVPQRANSPNAPRAAPRRSPLRPAAPPRAAQLPRRQRFRARRRVRLREVHRQVQGYAAH